MVSSWATRARISSSDCEEIAELLTARDRLPKALGRVERGLELANQDRSGHGLEFLHRALLVKLGRADEAQRSAWADFAEFPHRYSNKHLAALIPEA
jgi:hypothetical protein